MTHEELAKKLGGTLYSTIMVIDEVFKERRRQVDAEGWTPDHDDKHDAGEMVAAACAYALNATFDGPLSRDRWFSRLWPDGWDGDEPTADTPLPAYFADGTIQDLLI